MIVTIGLVTEKYAECRSERSKGLLGVEIHTVYWNRLLFAGPSLAQSASDCAMGSIHLPGRCLMKLGFHTLCGSALEGRGFRWHGQRLTVPKKFPRKVQQTASPAGLPGPTGTARPGSAGPAQPAGRPSPTGPVGQAGPAWRSKDHIPT